MAQEKYDIYFGSFGSRGGTYVLGYVFDEADGRLTYKSKIDGLFNPSYTNFDHDFNIFFSVTKDRQTNTGYVRTWKALEGGMVPVGQYETGGKDPCYVMADRTNTYAAASNYSSGSFRIWTFNAQGEMTPVGRPRVHKGSSVNPRRQAHPYCHSTVWSPWDDVLYVCDLGCDKVFWYKKCEKRNLFRRAGEAAVAPGSGPRHLTFAPNRRIAYLLNEMGSTLTVFEVLKSGALKQIQHVTTLPEGFTGENNCADVHVSADGRFVYASNRGHDTIAVFDVLDDGTVSLRQLAPTLGSIPRGFDLSPSGNWLVCANQDSANIVVFKRDQESGALEPVHNYQDIKAIVNVRFKLK